MARFIFFMAVLYCCCLGLALSSPSTENNRAERVPCLQSIWNTTTGECWITNECDFPIWGYALCDRDAAMCGSSKSEGIAMCGHSKFRLGDSCKTTCQGLVWNHTNSTQCAAEGKCCAPRTVC